MFSLSLSLSLSPLREKEREHFFFSKHYTKQGPSNSIYLLFCFFSYIYLSSYVSKHNTTKPLNLCKERERTWVAFNFVVSKLYI